MCLLNYHEGIRTKATSWIQFAWMPVYDENLTPNCPGKGYQSHTARPHPRQSRHQRRCRGRLPDVLCEFLGAGLVQRPVRLNEAQRVTCILYYYYLLVHHYYILLLDLLLLIITICYYTVITLLLHIITCCYNFCYYTVITSLFHIITSFIITCSYIFCYYTVITSLLCIITYSLLLL